MTGAVLIEIGFIVAISVLALLVLHYSGIPKPPRVLAACAVVLWMGFWLFKLWAGN